MILYVKMYRQMYLLKIETMDILPYKTRFSRDFFRKYLAQNKEKQMEITQKDAINKVVASKKSQITYLPPPQTNEEKTKLKRHIDDAFRKGHSLILVRIP